MGDIEDPFDEERIAIPEDEAGAAFPTMMADETGEIPRPMVRALLFLHHAWGEDPETLPPLDSLVTPESVGNWDMMQIGEAVADHAIASKVRYLDPHWTMILLPLDEGETYAVNREHPLDDPLAVYMRYDDDPGEWYVHAVGPPGLSVDEL